MDRPQNFRQATDSSTVVARSRRPNFDVMPEPPSVMPVRGSNLKCIQSGATLPAPNPELLLNQALNALSATADWRPILDELQTPIYTTDAEGAVTYWNGACVDLAGREPQLGQDRWCVTWRIYTTDGEFMPHDECPMAEAIKERREVRGKVAIALRPDGSRIAFRPYPTPLFDRDGNFTGAVNLLLDVTDEQAEALNVEAERCRRLADATFNREVADILGTMAEGYERTSGELSKARGI
jgi:PAS domain S-box-containing protein